MNGIIIKDYVRASIMNRNPLSPLCKELSLLVINLFLLIRILGGGVHTGSTRHVGHFWPIIPAPGVCEDGEFGGMKIGRVNKSTRRKPTPEPLCPPQIPNWPNLGANSGRQRLTTWAMARPILVSKLPNLSNLSSYLCHYRITSNILFVALVLYCEILWDMLFFRELYAAFSWVACFVSLLCMSISCMYVQFL
jgi:hypothetical protein